MKATINKCRSCPETENLHIHQRYLLKDGTFSTIYTCRSCNTARLRKYIGTPSGKERVWAASAKSQSVHKIETNARALMNYHLRKGRLTRPSSCTACHKECIPEGHHQDYSKPLDVMWLCRQCHADEHRRIKLTGNNK